MPSRLLTDRRFAAATFVAGGFVAAVMGATDNLDYVTRHPVGFALLTLGVILAELLPITIPRRGDDELITIATSFSLALLIVGGFLPALVAQLAASVIQDLSVRKPWWRIRFNFGQYTLSLAAAWVVLRLLAVIPRPDSALPFASSQLPAILLGATAFVIVNTAVVGTAVALYQEVPIRKYFRKDVAFIALTGGVLLCLAPIVAAAAAYSVALIPLFVLPMLAIYRAGREASRSDYAAQHDMLTGLPNRVAFRSTVNEVLDEEDHPACVLLMDLNRFKEVNDTLGHRYGDELLKQIAARLIETVGAEHAVARLGGDEFAVFARVAGGEPALEFAQQMIDTLRVGFELEEFVVDAEASVGIAVFPEDGRDLETLLQKADVAMYRAKETHTGVAVYDETHDHYSPAKLALTVDLRNAIGGEEIVLAYQPLLDLHTGQIPAVEALVRWQHPDLGLLLPGAFLDMAEHTSLIKPLTQRVLDLSLGQLAHWRAMGIQTAVAVNVSTRVLVDQGFAGLVMEALSRHQIEPRLLKLEVTESSLMADPVVARSVLTRLDQLGVEISIDDFGTGYSSLAYLADLPVSEVKIDRAFVSRLASGSRDGVIVRSTIDLGHHLGLRVVAEGVEQETTLRQLRELGCDIAQGYGISRPLPAAEATLWLKDRDPERPRRPLAVPNVSEAA